MRASSSTSACTRPGRPTQPSAAEAAEAILAFETRLAEASYTAAQLRDVPLTMNRHDFAALDELMPSFGLAGYLRDLGVTSPSVNVDNPGFFRALDVALAETPVETLRDYLRWHLVRTFAMSLTPAFENEAFDFYGKTLGGQQEMKPRWKRALASASADIGELVAQLYVETAFSEQAKQRCEEMVDHLLAAMGRAIRRVDWMSDATREEALRKLDGFSYKIGYPDVWRDYSALEIARDSFVQNRMRSEAFELARQTGTSGPARGPDRVGDAGAHRQRLLPPAAQRDRLPRGDPAAAVLLRGRRRRRELRRHRRDHRARDHARVRRRGQPLRRLTGSCATGGPRPTAPSSCGAPRCSWVSSTATRCWTACT